MPATAAEVGFTVEDVTDFENAMYISAHHMSDLTTENNSDQKLAMASYNGGHTSVAFVKDELSRDNITGQDWLNFMENRRHELPSDKAGAWQNETYKYIITIINGEFASHDQRTAKQQQLGGLPPNLMFIGAILAHEKGLITEKNFAALQKPMTGQFGPEVEVPVRPQARPNGLGEKMAEASQVMQSAEVSSEGGATKTSKRPQIRPDRKLASFEKS